MLHAAFWVSLDKDNIVYRLYIIFMYLKSIVRNGLNNREGQLDGD